MSGEGTPGLVEGAPVHVDLGGTGGSIACTVRAFLGPVILVSHDQPLPPSVAERLAAGTPAYLLVTGARQVKALRGRARLAGERELALELTDEFRLGQRREWTRIGLELDAGLKPLGIDQPAVATTTIDVSPGGVQVRRPEGMGVWPRYELTLSGGGLTSPVIGQVAPTRRLPDALGLRFTHVPRDHLERLIAIVLARTAGNAGGATP